MDHRIDERREVIEEARRGDYLAGGQTPETHIALLTRDMQYLIQRVKENEDSIKALEAKLATTPPDVKEMLEAYNRQKWFFKRFGMILLAVPAMGALWQGLAKLLEWIRGQ